MRPMKPRQPGSHHDALAQFLEQIGTRHGGDGVQLAADFEGITKWTIYKLLDPGQEGEFSYLRAARLTQHFGATGAAQHLADLCGAVLVVPPEASLSGDPLDQISAEALKEMSDVFLALAQARADRKIDGRDAAIVVAEIRGAMTKLAALMLQVEAEAGVEQ